MKEIEVPSFMNNKENQNLSRIEKRMLEKEELDRRLSSAPYPEKRSILDENKHNDRRKRIEEMRREKAKQQLVRKLAIYATYATVIVGGFTLVKHQINEVSKPINVVTFDIMANNNLLETDDGRKLQAEHFDNKDTEKLYAYIEENQITQKDLRESVAKYCKGEMLDYDFAMEKISERYPELFETSLNNKSK